MVGARLGEQGCRFAKAKLRPPCNGARTRSTAGVRGVAMAQGREQWWECLPEKWLGRCMSHRVTAERADVRVHG